MFIPPVPVHVPDVSGWGMMCDVTLCMPLFLFVRLNRCPMTPQLRAWLEHPLKRFYLIKKLPAALRLSVLEVSRSNQMRETRLK